jgi:hemerythrin
MPLLEWNENLSVGVPSIDAQHKKLVGMLNELYDAMQAGKSQAVLGKVLKELADYTVYHFQYEESLLAQTGYRASPEHKREHDELTKLVQEVSQKYEAGATPALSEEVLNFLRRWLFIHITGSDRKFGPYLISMGIS